MYTKVQVPTSLVRSRPARRRKPKVRRPPGPLERITLKAAAAQERLKAERVQEELRSLPAWKLAGDQRSIDRVREFSDWRQASVYMVLVAGLAGLYGQPVDLSYAEGRVVVTLTSLFAHGRLGLTRDALDFARLLG
jgi:pterin-4a-carbinolamine dehydratase